MRHKESALVSIAQDHERLGIPVIPALRRIMLDSARGWYLRGTAARLLLLADSRGAVTSLLDLFFAQTDKVELWETALTIEHAGDRAGVRRLIDALYDANPDRRHAATRALGWIPDPGRKAVKALIRTLLDKSQPQPVRQEAAESLGYPRDPLAIAPLISVLDESDVRLRFLAVFALGGVGQFREDLRVVEALERMLPDTEVPDGWWAIGREALAMLGLLTPECRSRLDSEMKRVLGDPNSSPTDLRWAEGYSS